MELFNDWDAKAFAEHLGMSAVHLSRVVAELKATWNVAGHRLQHIDNTPPDQEWEPGVA